jgi:hypothetical protein
MARNTPKKNLGTEQELQALKDAKIGGLNFD